MLTGQEDDSSRPAHPSLLKPGHRANHPRFSLPHPLRNPTLPSLPAGAEGAVLLRHSVNWPVLRGKLQLFSPFCIADVLCVPQLCKCPQGGTFWPFTSPRTGRLSTVPQLPAPAITGLVTGHRPVAPASNCHWLLSQLPIALSPFLHSPFYGAFAWDIQLVFSSPLLFPFRVSRPSVSMLGPD